MAASTRLLAACVSVVILGFAGVVYWFSPLINGSDKRKKLSKSQYEKFSKDIKVHQSIPVQSTSTSRNSGGNLTSGTAVALVGMLATQDDIQLGKVLVTISNSAAFTCNQELLREAGVLPLLVFLMQHQCEKIQIYAINALSNLALNYNNQKQLQDLECGVIAIKLLNNEDNCEELQLSLLRVLTNLSVSEEQHSSLLSVIPMLFHHFYRGCCEDVQLQSLKILVNFSSNEEAFPYMMKAEIEKTCFFESLSSKSENVLLRHVKFLSNLVQLKKSQNIDVMEFIQDDCQYKKTTCIANLLYGNDSDKTMQLLFTLSKHGNIEIRNYASIVSLN